MKKSVVIQGIKDRSRGKHGDKEAKGLGMNVKWKRRNKEVPRDGCP